MYEKNREKNTFCNETELIQAFERNIIKQNSLDLKFEYIKDKRKTKYKDIEIFVANKSDNKDFSYPDFINNIPDEDKKRSKKKEFRDFSKKYFIDDKTGRLKMLYNIYNKQNYKEFKELFISYTIEKINIVKLFIIL